MLRVILFIHRYLAVAVGLLMALWCLSGFVMMYQAMPELTQQERLAGLAPLRLQGCCHPHALPPADAPLGSFTIEMLDGRAVLRAGGAAPVDLATGEPVSTFTRGDLQRIAAAHARQRDIGGSSTPRWLGEVEIDQWTLQAARRNAPVHHFALDDAAGTELYVSGRSGEVFLDTNRRERVLAWLGAIPHWLYPTALRQHGAVWTQVVIWTSVIGAFLAATGIYVGIARLRRDRSGKLASPFRGWWYWHHIAGLVFGVLVLTWVFSGLLTMTPWGFLAGGDASARVRTQMLGAPPAADLHALLASAPSTMASGDFRQMRAAPFGGRLHVLLMRADGSSVRVDSSGQPSHIEEAQARAAFARLDTPVRALDLITREDAYYYGHKRDVALPAWRAVLDDDDRTHVYLDPASGQVRVVDGDAKTARWITQGLHSLDFRGLRSRPLWDVVTMLLLGGVTAVCVTGSWMAIRRVRRDFGGR